jgi:uncharacterized membrane protein
MIRRSPDLIVIIAAAWLVWLLAALETSSPGSAPAWLRIVSGLPLALVLPGYAWLAAIFPKSKLSGVERFVLSIALSLAVVILTGLLLHLSQSGLSPLAWSVSLSLLTWPVAFYALARREIANHNESEEVSLPPPTPAPRLGLRMRQAALVLATGIVVLSAIIISLRPAPAQELAGYTQLWLLPIGEERTRAVWLGINSHEFAPRTYRLELQVNGQAWHTLDDLALAPGETWYTVVMLPPDWNGRGELTARLYPQDEPEQIYREVVLRQGLSGLPLTTGQSGVEVNGR